MKSCISFLLKLSPHAKDRDDAMLQFSPTNHAFLPTLTLPAPERIHAEGNLGRWQEAARLPWDPPPPQAPELTAGEPLELVDTGPCRRTRQSACG